jgi:hypothetical protein
MKPHLSGHMVMDSPQPPETNRVITLFSGDSQVSTNSRPISTGEMASSGHEKGPLPGCPHLQMQSRFGFGITSNAMTAVVTSLFDCARLSYARFRLPLQATIVVQMTELDEVQRSVAKVVGAGWEDAITAIRQHLSVDAARDIHSRYIQAYYWVLIKEEAEKFKEDDLPAPRGRLTEFSRAEKAAAERFMARLGLGMSAQNQWKCRKRWKRLHEMREAGIEKLLLYRNTALDILCESWPDEGPRLHEVMLALEKAYRPHFLRLEAGATMAHVSGLTARVWLGDLAERLEVPEASWNAYTNNWFSTQEKHLCSQLLKPAQVAVVDELRGLRDICATDARNKSLFVGPFEKDERSLAVVPIVAVNEGDLLGLYSGELRYSEQFDGTHGIRSPIPNLWLDSSRVTGPLNQMRVTRQQEEANVALDWQLCHEPGESDPEWRVVGLALRKIRPWEEMVRLVGEAEYLLHQDASSARIGFLEPPVPSESSAGLPSSPGEPSRGRFWTTWFGARPR